jgi:integrase
MPYADVPAFMRELRGQDGIARRALEFTVLTVARVGESLGARWDEIAGEVWTVPATRMKGRREHRVPLSKPAIELVEALPRTGEHLFPADRSQGRMPNNTPRRLLTQMGHVGLTVHGFRSSFRDWAAERTGYANHVLEMALAHAVGSAVEAAYRRGDLFEKRRELMADWAHYCSRQANGEVVALEPRRGRK